MSLEFLKPVEEALLEQVASLPDQSLGKTLSVHTLNEGLPDLADIRLALIGIESGSAVEEQAHAAFDLAVFRGELYKMFSGNWKFKMADLGTLQLGTSNDDNLFAIQALTATLRAQNILVFFVGGHQDLTLGMYRAYSQKDTYVNITTLDKKFDFGDPNVLISSHSYMSRIIMEQPNRLLAFTNLGYQTFYNAQEEIKLIERLHFEAYRLGSLLQDLSIAEPILRDTDILSVDFSVLKSQELQAKTPSPNGLSALELCSLMRYTGLSDRVSSVGLFELPNTDLAAAIASQAFWYVCEGVAFRRNEYPFSTKSDCAKFHVPTPEHELVFYKSHVSERWWVSVPRYLGDDNKNIQKTLIPCTHQDYLEACDQQIPERWWKAFRRNQV